MASIGERTSLPEATSLGVLGYVETSMSVAEFVAALSSVMDGTPMIPEIERHEPTLRISERQLDLLRLLQRGLSSKQIAHELHIAEGTAKNHTLVLLRMLGATNRAHAVARAMELGLLSTKEPR